MGLNITSNYSGEHAGQYIAAALKAAKTLDYVTVLENVKYKRNISSVANADVVRDATCDFTDYGTLTLTEKVLNPKELQVNLDLCKKDLLAEWTAQQMGVGAHNRSLGNDFQTFVISHIAEIIANAVEGAYWSGADATNGSFEGMTTTTTGHFAIDAPTTVSKSATFAAATMITELETLAAAIPSNVYQHAADDLYIYMNPKTYRFYIQKVSSLGYVNQYGMTEEYQPFFEGIKIAVCPGLGDDKMVAARKSNLFFGTDLVSDHTEIRLLDMSELDGSDNVRVVCKFTAGGQTGIASDITYMS